MKQNLAKTVSVAHVCYKSGSFELKYKCFVCKKILMLNCNDVFGYFFPTNWWSTECFMSRSSPGILLQLNDRHM